MVEVRTRCGFSAFQCGEALPHRPKPLIRKKATPPDVEAQPRRKKSNQPLTESQSLSALEGGKAAITGLRQKQSWAAPTILCFLLSGSFILLLLPASPASSQSVIIQPSPFPSPSPTPSPAPSPSPTPVTGLHQWGAVTLFHGLPSDRVLAVAQGPDGAMWFGTDGGLAKLEGRRTQAVSHPNLPAGRVLALKTDEDGSV